MKDAPNLAMADSFMGIFGMKRVKPKRCTICKGEFVPRNSLQKVCGIECAKTHAETLRIKRERDESKKARQDTKKRKESLKTRREWLKEAQIAFNRFIRERDKQKPCICCGLPLEQSAVGGGFDCGHYRSVGSAPHLRFAEDNAHGQRKQCNRWGAGRAVDYRLGLIQRIGIDRVESLEADQDPKHYTIDDLKAIIATYKAKMKELNG